MKIKRMLIFGIVGLILSAGLSSCIGDPRKNCNHPEHGRYMQQKLAKKRGI